MNIIKKIKKIPFDELLVLLLIMILATYIIMTFFNKNIKENFYNIDNTYINDKESITATNGSLVNDRTKELVISENFASSSEGEEEINNVVSDSTSEGTVNNNNNNGDNDDNVVSDSDIESTNLMLAEINRRRDLIQTAYDNKESAEKEYNQAKLDLDNATKRYNKAAKDQLGINVIKALELELNSANNAFNAKSRVLEDANRRLNDLEQVYPEEYKSTVPSTNDPSQSQPSNTQTTSDKKTVIHNHYNQYYGGNKELSEFLKKLVDQMNGKDLNTQDDQLMNQGMCSDLNNELSTMTLAEFKNNRFIQELKSKCEKNAGDVDCSWGPSQDQTALIGTLLDTSKKTKVGDIIPKEKISTDYV